MATVSGQPLYEVDPKVAEMLAEQNCKPVLLHALAGFVDAGAGASLAADHLRSHYDPAALATFDADGLIDHRARRPRMHFATDKYTSVDLPTITLDVLQDDNDQTFLLLSGFEPDVRWDQFTAEVVDLAERFQVRLAVGINAIPWNSPHTRPVGLTPHATDRALIAGRPRWVDDIDVPGSVDALIELRLGEADLPACGFAAHVPHYLSSTDYPPAAVALLEAVSETTGLQFTVDKLREAGASVLSEVDSQVADSPETAEAVATMESQYDAQAAGEETDGMSSPHLPDDELIGGDKVVADFERYLRDIGNDPGGSNPGGNRE